MKRRRFLSVLAAAFLAPPIPVQEIILPKLPKFNTPNFYVLEMIGVTMANERAMVKVKFD